MSDGVPAEFEIAESEVWPGADAGYVIAYRVVEAGDPDEWDSPISVARMAYLSEWSGIGAPDEVYAETLNTGESLTQSVGLGGGPQDLLFAMFGIHTDQPDRIVHVDGATTLQFEDWHNGPPPFGGFGPYVSVGTVPGDEPATAEYQLLTYEFATILAANFPAEVGPETPPVDPGYTPPGAGSGDRRDLRARRGREPMGDGYVGDGRGDRDGGHMVRRRLAGRHAAVRPGVRALRIEPGRPRHPGRSGGGILERPHVRS